MESPRQTSTGSKPTTIKAVKNVIGYTVPESKRRGIPGSGEKSQTDLRLNTASRKSIQPTTVRVKSPQNRARNMPSRNSAVNSSSLSKLSRSSPRQRGPSPLKTNDKVLERNHKLAS